MKKQLVFFLYSMHVMSCYSIVQPDLSIILPLYGQDEHITACLDSIVQDPLFERYEILIFHIQASEKTYEEVMKYMNKYSNILYFRVSEKNLAHIFNLGIQLCSSPYITRFFTHMRLKPFGFDLMLEDFKNNGSKRVVYAQYYKINSVTQHFYDIYKFSIDKWLMGDGRIIDQFSPIIWQKSLHEQFGLFSEGLFANAFLSFFGKLTRYRSIFQYTARPVLVSYFNCENTFLMEDKYLVITQAITSVASSKSLSKKKQGKTKRKNRKKTRRKKYVT